MRKFYLPIFVVVAIAVLFSILGSQTQTQAQDIPDDVCFVDGTDGYWSVGTVIVDRTQNRRARCQAGEWLVTQNPQDFQLILDSGFEVDGNSFWIEGINEFDQFGDPEVITVELASESDFSFTGESCALIEQGVLGSLFEFGTYGVVYNTMDGELYIYGNFSHLTDGTYILEIHLNCPYIDELKTRQGNLN